MLATTDALDKVEAFYEKKTGEKLKPDPPAASSGSRPWPVGSRPLTGRS